MTSLLEDLAQNYNPISAPDFVPACHTQELQFTRLKSIVRRAYDHGDLFRARMQERDLTPEDIRSLDDVSLLPFTVKADLRDTYPFGLLTSPMSEVVRLHVSSGTTGKPIVVAYTKEDVNVWTNVMARSFAACGLNHGDIIQNAYGYGLFTGGLGAHYGAEELGATVIPISGGHTDRQIMIMCDFHVTAICCTPSYFIHLIDHARGMGIDMHDLPIRVGIFGAEPWTDSMRKRIEQDAGIQAFDIYGLSEITGPGVAIECPYHNGLHIFEDHFYPEIVDPDTGETLPDGAEGELVLTTLSKKAMPMIRYRTRDITTLIGGRCPCGRTLRRMRRVGRRSDDMFIIRGINVFPSQVETALLAVEGTLPHYQIILTRAGGLDEMEVKVEVTPEVFSDRVGSMENLAKKLDHELERTIGLRAAVRLVRPNTLERSEGKAKRVDDRRNLDE
ncbi:MAG: phenylacetate--CoA ligase [Capsulimonadaceae bacterium]|nr:phenylacetate--CoA ligase [Capsulimonadaceae bacterium]